MQDRKERYTDWLEHERSLCMRQGARMEMGHGTATRPSAANEADGNHLRAAWPSSRTETACLRPGT
jgi:hypothetical protein